MRGQGGASLAEVWGKRPYAYMGVGVPRFPNAFFMLGPNTGLGHNSVVIMAEVRARAPPAGWGVGVWGAALAAALGVRACGPWHLKPAARQWSFDDPQWAWTILRAWTHRARQPQGHTLTCPSPLLVCRPSTPRPR